MSHLGAKAEGASIALPIALVLFVAWGGWLTIGSLPIVITSPRARLEAKDLAQPLQAQANGFVAQATHSLGDHVTAGDTLVTLDDTALRQELAKLRWQKRDYERQIASLRMELAHRDSAVTYDSSTALRSLDLASARVMEAQSSSELAQQSAMRARALRERGFATAADVEKEEATLAQQLARLDAARSARAELVAQRRRDGTDRLAASEEVRRALATNQMQLASALAAITAIEAEHQRLVIRAPTSGHIAELATLHPGAPVRIGDVLGTVLPERNETRIVAHFAPSEAAGRVYPGQRGFFRADAFVRSQFAPLPVRILRVARESRDGLLRVEAEVESTSSALPRQHGITGQLDVEVERAAPGVLLLHAIGVGQRRVDRFRTDSQ